jgi:hypothetical protein
MRFSGVPVVATRTFLPLTYRVEHKKINNRFLRVLGWVVVVRNRRPNPRFDELALAPEDVLLRRYRTLKTAMNRPGQFLFLVFCDRVSIWEKRCSGILRAKPSQAEAAGTG